MGEARVAQDKKNAARRGAALAWADETGFCLTPTVRRTWAPRGQTPVLRHAQRHQRKVSGIGALTLSPQRRRLGAYLHLYRDAEIGQEGAVAFLQDLRRHVGRRLTVLWDGGSTHRGVEVRAFPARVPDLQVEPLPPYAPELNPAEGMWGNMKGHRLANHGRLDVEDLEAAVADEFRDLRHDQNLLRSSVFASGLPIRLPGARTLKRR